jgi:predicted nucleic acid-binding protein
MITVGVFVATRLELISALPITTDQETIARAWRDVLFVARSDGLTTYDAAYLELAMRRGVKVLPLPADPPKPGRRRRPVR